ncbi:MAG TPA: Clp1/GlmU family protein [Candidatus Acidoferrales bacterium]|nr:Clp1/GlmU family protein [Candidatus Acidoferrales bacterium]
MADPETARASPHPAPARSTGTAGALGRVIPESWSRVFEALAANEGVTAFLGPTDAGKTTCVRAAADYLLERGRAPVGVVDADVGQASVGPPAAVGLAILKRPTAAGESLPVHALQFVGAVSPAGYLLQTVTATARLVETARAAGARRVLVDTSGLIGQGIGFQLKLNKLDRIAPRDVVALERGDELKMLLSVLGCNRRLTIHRLPVSPAVRERSPAERYRYRVERFGEYFRAARERTFAANRVIVLAPAARYSKFLSSALPPVLAIDSLPRAVAGALVGINDGANRTLALGLIRKVRPEARELVILTPLADTRRARIIQLGSLRLAENGEDLDRVARQG